VAALIKQETGIDSEVTPGNRGEFSIWVNDRKVAEKSATGFPTDREATDAVKTALG
jgi:hypothetical protein